MNNQNTTNFGTFGQTVNNLIPILLNFVCFVGILLLIGSIVFACVKHFKYKENVSTLLGHSFLMNGIMLFSTLLIRFIMNYDPFLSSRVDMPVSFMIIVWGFIIMGLNPNRKKGAMS